MEQVYCECGIQGFVSIEICWDFKILMLTGGYFKKHKCWRVIFRVEQLVINLCGSFNFPINNITPQQSNIMGRFPCFCFLMALLDRVWIKFDWITLLSVSLHDWMKSLYFVVSLHLLLCVFKMSAHIWLLHFSTALKARCICTGEGKAAVAVICADELFYTSHWSSRYQWILVFFSFYTSTQYLYIRTQDLDLWARALHTTQQQRNYIWLLFLRRLSLLCLNLGESLVPEPPY